MPFLERTSVESTRMRLSRRGILQTTAACSVYLGAFGFGGFPNLPRRSFATESAPKRAKACILLWLDGGPSHLEMFDPKPEAPAEIRGAYRAVESNVPGIRLGEWMPKTSRICDKLAIVRSVTSPLGEHGLANRYMLTGYKPSAVEYPSIGAVVQHQKAEGKGLPSHIAIPEIRFSGAGFLGSRFEPFATGGDPSKQDFQVKDLVLSEDVTPRRLDRRRVFLQKIEDSPGSTGVRSLEPSMQKAFSLMQSGVAQDAFDLSKERAETRDRYGARTFGQSCLLARRLVQRGVSFVTVQFSGWDTHENLKLALRDGYSGAKEGVGLLPTFDQGYSALIEDLDRSGLLEETLVVVMGEFGRTPKLNTRGGRDHWPRVFSMAFAGGGVVGGQVIGSSDRIGESPRDQPVTPADLAYSIYHLLGIDPTLELRTPDGRPIPLVQGGKWIPQLA